MSFNFESFLAAIGVTFVALLVASGMTCAFAMVSIIIGFDPWTTIGVCWGIMLTVGVVVGVLDN